MYCNCNVNVITVQIFATFNSFTYFSKHLLYSSAESRRKTMGRRNPIPAERFSPLPLYFEGKVGGGLIK